MSDFVMFVRNHETDPEYSIRGDLVCTLPQNVVNHQQDGCTASLSLYIPSLANLHLAQNIWQQREQRGGARHDGTRHTSRNSSE